MKSLILILFGVVTLAVSGIDARAGATNENPSSQSTELGAPVPGSVSDQESTVTQRNPSKDQTTEQSSQMTLGGAKYSVIGEVLKVEGKYFFVKDADSGDEVRLVVNNDTQVRRALQDTHFPMAPPKNLHTAMVESDEIMISDIPAAAAPARSSCLAVLIVLPPWFGSRT
jgi:hypothetical protein